MKKLVMLCLAIGIAGFAKAQSTGSTYKTALGVKFYPGAISLKHFVRENAAIEGLAYFRENGMRITGLYAFHAPLAGVDGLQWYVGPGAHLGFYNSKDGKDGYATIGIDGVLGIDYKIKGAPLNVSVDWQPSFEFTGRNDGFYGGWGGFAVRYTF